MYIAAEPDGLRYEMRTLQQPTANNVDEVMDQRMAEFGEEEAMFDAIWAAVDEAVASIRD